MGSLVRQPSCPGEWSSVPESKRPSIGERRANPVGPREARRRRIVVRRKRRAGITWTGARRVLLHEDDFHRAVAPEHVHADVLAVAPQLEVDEPMADAQVADPDR